MSFLDSGRLLDDAVIRARDRRGEELLPLAVSEPNAVQGFELGPQVDESGTNSATTVLSALTAIGS